MRFTLTAAAQRAMERASAWADEGEIPPQALLAALAEMPESRAAVLLAQLGVDSPTIVQRWQLAVELPEASDTERAACRPSPKIEEALHWVCQHLESCPRPLVLATEDLLMGLASINHPVADWLYERGLDVRQVSEELLRRHGYDPTPLEVDWLDPSLSSNANAAAAERRPPSTALARGEPETPTDPAVWRILDASANRAGEALRVLEDYLRMVLDDSHLTELAKQLRHDLTACIGRIPARYRIAARDTAGDVGVSLSTAAEQFRHDARHVVDANFRRLQESLRSLEEYVKIVDTATAADFEALRYRSYTLERAVGTTADSLQRLAAAKLYVLIDGRDHAAAFEDLAAQLVEAGVDILQLRDKKLPDRELLDRADRLRRLTRNTPTLCIVNDRPDVAALADADGVHVGQDELTVAQCRRIVGPRRLVGVSTHSLAQARQAVVDGASYIGVGPIFPSSTKTFAQFPGLELARHVAGEIRLPAFAIGGIDTGNLPNVLATGMCRVAVQGALLRTADPGRQVRKLKQMLASADGSRRTTEVH